MENQPFLLVELEDLSSIFAPLKTTSRIKYTCFNVSNNFLIFGATSGGLYIFHREPCCFLQLLPNKEGSVTQVAISPDEKLIAFSTIKGIVCVLERLSHSIKHLVTTSEHQNDQITCLQWNSESNELYVGDNSGKVSIVTVSMFPKKSMFQTPSFVLMQLDSKVVQMDFNSNMLLVSTLTKCYICDTTKEIFRQVGHKLRDGEYGACIFNSLTDNEKTSSNEAEGDRSFEYPNLSHLKLLCARPGSRVWEAAVDGTVISTHHFKEALAVPPEKIFFLSNSSSQNSDLNNSILSNGSCLQSEQINSNFTEQSFNFQKLYIVSKFFFTFKSDGIYVFDPQKATVVLWNNEITNIVDVKCIRDVIYVWSGYGKMYALNLVPLEKLLLRLYFQKKYLLIAKLCIEFESFLTAQGNNCTKLYVLHDLDEKLKGEEKLCDRLKPLIRICKESAQKRKTQNAQKLKSGIYVVSNNDQLLLESRRGANQRLLRPSYLNLKGRSHSVSPERFQNGGLKSHGSTSSLPDLVKEDKIELSDVVVNGRKEKSSKVSQSKVDVESILNACEALKSQEPSEDMIFSLFDQILALGKTPESHHNLKQVQSLPLKSYFNEKNLKVISDCVNSSLRSKIVFKWVDRFNGDWLASAVNEYPEFLVRHHSTKDLEIDFRISKVLKLVSNVLNEYEIIDVVKKTGMKCYYRSLLEILDVYHDSSFSSVSVSNLNLANVTSYPKILNIAYFLMNVGQTEQCSKYSYKINSHDMCYLMLKFEETSKKSGKSSDIIELQCHTLFLSYIEKASIGNEFLKNSSELVEDYVVHCLENINRTASCVREANCSCGFPYPGLQPSITMFPDVGHALVDKTWPSDPEKCLDICGRVPYLWKYLLLTRRDESLNTLLPLLVQLGDMQELEIRLQTATQNIEDCVKNIIKLKTGRCLGCRKEIPNENAIVWTDFGLLCVKLIGAKETLDLFTKYSADIHSRELDQTFYQGLVFSSIMEKHSKGLRKNVVDLLTGRGASESNRVAVFSDKIRKDILGRSDTSFQTESSSHHWGVKVNFKSNCTVCSLPLDTKVLISEVGLIVFKCSHVFHSACLRKTNVECPLCKSQGSNGC